jgi:long-subunit fatty acid transport protein
MTRERAALLSAVLWLLPASAMASPLFELTGDVAGRGGLNARVASPDAASAYFNPALLGFAESGLTLGFFVLAERIDVDLDARRSAAACKGGACDVPAVNGAGPESFRHADDSRINAPTLPTTWLQRGRRDSAGMTTLAARPRGAQNGGSSEHAYAVIGLVQDILNKRVVFGLYTMMPLDDFMHSRAFYSDEREQFFSNSLYPELYADRLTPVSLAFGAGVRVTDTLALGVSLSLDIDSDAGAPVYVPNLADLDALLLDSDVGVKTALSPHVGVSWAPAPALRLSATLHAPQSVEIETGFRYVIATGIEQSASQRFVHDYLPFIIGLGAELDLGHTGPQRWALAAATTYALWSSYKDRHGENPSGAYAWSDVFSASLGVRHDVYAFRSFLDVGFQPSPVAAQHGRTNYVDGDRGSLSLGTSYGFMLLGQHASVGVQGQLHRVFPQSVRKTDTSGKDGVRDEVPDDAVGGLPRGPIAGREGLQTNNPGYPGYASQGVIFGGGASFNLAF